MKNVIRILGIIALAAIIGLGMSACDMLDSETSLAIPANVQVEADASGFFLKWDVVPGAASYLVDINGETFPAPTTNYSLQSLITEHKVYQLKVKAIAPGGNAFVTDSAFSDPINCEPAVYIFTFEANSPLRITGLTSFGKTLETIVIPEQIRNGEVTAIGNGAFENNTTMVSVVIPATVTAVGDNAFSGATGLSEVTFESTTPPSFGTGVFEGATALENIIVPGDSVEAYTDKIAETAPDLTDKVTEPPAQPTQKTLENIQVIQPRTQYNAGEQFNPQATTVIANYTDRSSAQINNYTIWLRTGTGAFVEGNRPLNVNDTVIRLSYTENGITRTVDIAITVTAGGGNPSHGFAQIGLYNLLTNQMYMGYDFSPPANNITWGTLVAGTYLRGDFATLDALITRIISEMLGLGNPIHGANNPRLVQIGVNEEIIYITPQTVILPLTNIRVYFHGVDVPPETTPGLTQLATPTNIRVGLSGGMEFLMWNAVAGATGYTISVAGANGTIERTLGGTEYPLMDISVPGTYMITVKALGDGVSFTDSPFSAPYQHTVGGTTNPIQFTLTVVNGTGTITANPGTQVTATATVSGGRVFVGWAEDGVIVSTANPYTFSLSRNITLTAVFDDAGGGPEIISVNYTFGQLLEVLNSMGSTPVPVSISVGQWNDLLPHFGRYSSFESMFDDVIKAIAASTSYNVVNLTLRGDVPIQPFTRLNEHYMIHYEAPAATVRTLDRIQTVQTPRTEFIAGELYHIGHGTVIAIYTDAPSAPINGLFSIWLINSVGNFAEGNRPLTANDTVVRLSYTEGGITATLDINITVTGGNPTVPQLAPPTNIRVEFSGGLEVLRWDIVPNAIGYIVFIENQGETTVSANSYVLPNLTAGMHRISVRAMGDGTNYSDSDAMPFVHIVQ